MELRRLHYFLRVATEGSLGKASRALGVAQPALGRQVQMLEAELGVQLFERVTKGMRLTYEGEYLRDALEQPLEMVGIALRNVRSYAVPVEASLVLGLPPVIAEFLGHRLIARLQRDLPNLSLRIAEGDSSKLAAELEHGTVDIALLVGVIPPDKIFHTEVVSEDLMLVVPIGSQIACQDEVAFRDLNTLPLILPGRQTSLRTKLEKAELAAELIVNIALEIDSTELAKQAVRAGYGYAILPQLAFSGTAERTGLIGIRIVHPSIDQIVRWAVRPLWRVSRAMYDQVEAAIFEEWHATVSSGEWPGRWLFDLTTLNVGTSSGTKPEATSEGGKPMLDWHRF